MKKLMLGMTAAIAMVACGEVASENIVGYTQQEVKAGKFAMVGTQFTEVASTGVNIQKFITGDFTGSPWDEDGAFYNTAPQIQAWDGKFYTYYFYLNDPFDESIGEEGDFSDAPGWADSDGILTDVNFAPGDGVWFKANADCTIQSVGQIYNADAVEKKCMAGKFTMIANSKPVALNLNDANQVEFVGINGIDWDEDGAFYNTAPQIQVWDGKFYTYYFYLNNPFDESIGDEGDFSDTPGWADSDGVLVQTATIPAGRAFWVKAVTGEFTVKFTK